MLDQTYLHNPFLLKNVSDEEISKTINELCKRYKPSDLPYEVAYNIEIESDLLMLYGEMIARLTEEASLLKLDANAIEEKAIYQLRNDWEKTNKGKAPAIDYFKAQASEISRFKRKEQMEKESMLKRFVRAYTSVESKQNALKKKLEAMKWETI